MTSILHRLFQLTWRLSERTLQIDRYIWRGSVTVGTVCTVIGNTAGCEIPPHRYLRRDTGCPSRHNLTYVSPVRRPAVPIFLGGPSWEDKSDNGDGFRLPRDTPGRDVSGCTIPSSGIRREAFKLRVISGTTNPAARSSQIPSLLSAFCPGQCPTRSGLGFVTSYVPESDRLLPLVQTACIVRSG
jgi:hypothetical protein